MTTAKMSKQEALEYIETSPPDAPIFQKALITLNRQDSRRTRMIAWMALGVSVASLAVSVLALVVKTQ